MRGKCAEARASARKCAAPSPQTTPQPAPGLTGSLVAHVYSFLALLGEKAEKIDFCCKSLFLSETLGNLTHLVGLRFRTFPAPLPQLAQGKTCSSMCFDPHATTGRPVGGKHQDLKNSHGFPLRGLPLHGFWRTHSRPCHVLYNRELLSFATGWFALLLVWLRRTPICMNLQSLLGFCSRSA